MKKILLIIFTTLVSISIYAQKIRIKKVIVYVNDSAYCKLNEGSNYFGSSTLSILSLDNNELLFIKDVKGTDYCNFSFLEAKQKVKIDVTSIGLNWKSDIIKMLFNNKMIENNTIKTASLENFILKYEYDEEYVLTNYPRRNYPHHSRNEYPYFIERDRYAQVNTDEFNIVQDFKIIAKYNYTSTIINSKIFKVYNIYLPTGEKVADFKVEEFKAQNNSLYIYRSDKTIAVIGINGIDLENTIIKRVAEVLIESRNL